MQIKITMRYHLTPVRMATINKATNAGEDEEERGTLLNCRWECRLVQTLWKAIWSFLKKVKMELHYDPAIPLL